MEPTRSQRVKEAEEGIVQTSKMYGEQLRWRHEGGRAEEGKQSGRLGYIPIIMRC